MSTNDEDLDAGLLQRAEAILRGMAQSATGTQMLAELMQQIAQRISSNPSSGRLLGPTLGRLRVLQHGSTASSESLHWVNVGGGRLAIGHRPKLRSFTQMRAQGCTHVLTLLSEREGAPGIGIEARGAGIEWVWFPLENGAPPDSSLDVEAHRMLQQLNCALDQGAGLYVHCSAGIHRTGMVAFALLRVRGLPEPDARATLARLRSHTAEGVGSDRLLWAERLSSANIS